MKSLLDLSADEAKEYFLKGSSYFNADFPNYISFEPILKSVEAALGTTHFQEHWDKKNQPGSLPDVNYRLIANKDGRLAWRPLELIHPAIYVSLVNLICNQENWAKIVARFALFKNTCVICCSVPIIETGSEKAQAAQVTNWWQTVEQRSLKYSLEFSHLLHTDVTDCYGSIYTHSIVWALDGLEPAKESKGKGNLLGDKIDEHIRAGRYGQTNGISQGSVLMDFIAELVLGYVDEKITAAKVEMIDFKIIRYRDDYRIFTNSDVDAEHILKEVSDSLWSVGMKLGVAKTYINTNVVEGSIKPDKLAGIHLQDLGKSNAKTFQKKLLRLHSFGKKYPNSGVLKTLLGNFHDEIIQRKVKPEDIEVQVAIATDIAFVSPQTFPAVAAILSHMISLAPTEQKKILWEKVHKKMSKVAYNGYLEVWLQRVGKPIAHEFDSAESICKIVNGESVSLWNSDWIANKTLKAAIDAAKIVIADPANSAEVISPKEIQLFQKNALYAS